MNKKMLLSIALIAVTAIVGNTMAQQYRVLTTEDFGTGTPNPSGSPTAGIAPGTSSYIAQTTLAPLVDGSYALSKNPQGFDNFGNVVNAWQHGGDHTTGTGYMMLINANPAKQGEAKGSYYLYSTSALDFPGATYMIDFWGANVIRYNIGTGFKNAYIGVAVRNTSDATGTLYNNTGTNQWILPRAPGTQNTIPWVNRSVAFTLPTNYNSPTLYFNFYNTDTNSSTFGNDLGIDDITIKMQVITLSGTVFNDANGNTVINGGEPGINGATTPVYAYLIKANGTIGAKVQVQADGTYLFDVTQGIPYATGNIGLKVSISTQNQNIGDAFTTLQFPTGYVTTGENVNGATATAGSADGTIFLTATAANTTNLNFGIEQPPTAGSGSNSTLNPGGTTQVTVPANTFTNTANSTDPTAAPNGVTSIRITAFPAAAATVIINGTSYTSSTFPPAGILIPANANGVPTQTITVDPVTNGTTSVSIPFNAVDAAGKESVNTAAQGTAVLNLTAPPTVNISGTVFNDANGLVAPGLTVDGTPIRTASTEQLHVNLFTTTGVFVATIPVDGSGNYEFTNVTPNSGYQITVSTTAAANGSSSANSVALPVNWVNTGENMGDGPGNDSQPNGTVSVKVAGANVTDVNFGIEQIPVVTDQRAITTTNPGGSTQSPVTFPGGEGYSGTDPEDGTYPVLLNGKRVTLYPATGGTLYYDADGSSGPLAPTPVTSPAGQTFTGFNPAWVTVGPAASGTTNVLFDYAVADNAGVISAPKTVTVPFNTPLPVTLVQFTAVKEQQTALLSWSTTEETNSERFDIQHSSNGKNWNEIGSVNAQGESTTRHNYSFVHKTPANGINYYRLKMIDLDGTYSFSNIRTIYIQTNQVRIYPNPVADVLTIETDLASLTKVQLYNLTGEAVYDSGAKVTDNSINVRNLPGGVYVVRLSHNDGTFDLHKIVVTK